jgi:hypothetical protein
MEDTLNGSRFVKRIIRPPRIAFIVNSLQDVEKFISISSLSWGGRHFLAIPCNNEGLISDEWLKVLKKYNPDGVKTFHDITPDTDKKLWESRFTVSKPRENTEIKTESVYHNPGGGERVPDCFGQPVINLMLLDDFYEGTKGKAKISYVPLASDYDLFYKARFGVIDEGEWLRWQHIYISPPHRKNHPNEIIDNMLPPAGTSILSHIHQNRHQDHLNADLSLVDYTMTRLGHVYIDRFLEQQPKSETTHIVIVSETENVEDFCWFWAIRGQRYHPYDTYSKGPLWISRQMLVSSPNMLKDLFVNRKNIFVISKSIAQIDLSPLGDDWIFQTDNLEDFYNDHYYIGDTIDVPVNFTDNETEYKFEAPESLKYLDFSHHQYVMLDIQVPGITLPKIRDFRSGKVSFANYWITKSGLTRGIYSTRDEIVKLTVPTPWDVVFSFADAANYRLENSDKGSVGNELVRLIDGVENLWIISNPQIIGLMLEMSNVNKINEVRRLIRENVPDEGVKKKLINSLPRKSLNKKRMSYSAIKSYLRAGDTGRQLDEASAVTTIKWLLDKKLLWQGKNVTCKRCFTDNWVPVDKFATTILCTGCMNEIRNPFPIDRLEWEYEINTLVSAEIDQGLLVHLLTGFYLFDEANSPFKKSGVYGSFFGLKFVDVKGEKEKEIDIAFVANSQLVIGECKVSGRQLAAKEIEEYRDFAKEISSPKVIFSCFEHVEELKAEVKKVDHKGIEIVILGKDELFNQVPGLTKATQFHEENPEETPINKHKTYMKNLEIRNND